MPVDVFARGVARVVMQDAPDKTLYYPRDMRRLGKPPGSVAADELAESMADTQRLTRETLPDEDATFGWPPRNDR